MSLSLFLRRMSRTSFFLLGFATKIWKVIQINLKVTVKQAHFISVFCKIQIRWIDHSHKSAVINKWYSSKYQISASLINNRHNYKCTFCPINIGIISFILWSLHRGTYQNLEKIISYDSDLTAQLVR